MATEVEFHSLDNIFHAFYVQFLHVINYKVKNLSTESNNHTKCIQKKITNKYILGKK